MFEIHGQKILLSLFCVCFACLLVTGADRLIESGIEPIPLADEMPRVVFICSMQTQAEQNDPAARRDDEIQRVRLYLRESDSGSAAITANVCCDSNGNILSGCSYMHAVYQAFALGDGFV